MDKLYNFLKQNKSLENMEYNYQIDDNLSNLKKIYNNSWTDNSCKVPYVAITQLIDSYTHLKIRPDLAFLFCWEAINNSYNELLLIDVNYNRLQDTAGLKKLIQEIHSNYSKYEIYIKPYIHNIPDKLLRYFSSIVLKGIAIDNANISPKFINSSFNTFKKNYPSFYDIIADTYGQKFLANSNPTVINNTVKFQVDKNFSRAITHSLALKIKELLTTGTTILNTLDNKSSHTLQFTDEDIISFVIFQILYSSRCSNFHGNVASRLTSIYANQDSYDSYKYLTLFAHMLLGLCFHINGYIDDTILLSLKENEKLL